MLNFALTSVNLEHSLSLLSLHTMRYESRQAGMYLSTIERIESMKLYLFLAMRWRVDMLTVWAHYSLSEILNVHRPNHFLFLHSPLICCSGLGCKMHFICHSMSFALLFSLSIYDFIDSPSHVMAFFSFLCFTILFFYIFIFLYFFMFLRFHHIKTIKTAKKLPFHTQLFFSFLIFQHITIYTLTYERNAYNTWIYIKFIK